MPSPFPGMDPYLESPDIWPDFHDALAAEIRGELNRVLPQPYYARMEMRPEIGIVGDETPQRIVPDVAIVRPKNPPEIAREGGLALLEKPRAAISPSVWMRIANEPLRHHYVEIRDAARGHSLVTLIEIASPTNKRPGRDRRAYESKQQEILGSDTSLIELDLLRAGQPLIAAPAIIESAAILEPPPDYLVAVNRAWQRGAALQYQLFPVRLEERLPCIPVPLRENEAEPMLDLQFVFQQAYDRGPYARGAVDYESPPDPPVRGELSDWLQTVLPRKK
jgi:hypothetical protein